ncbi:PTS glucose transporter subunit IIA [Heyndrickxia coagulans]|uniref:PTS glucose transporter subunit IIA n=1 Tax=Heyndrickxia coagulans TaxID=1398 RepID=UPI0034A09D84
MRGHYTRQIPDRQYRQLSVIFGCQKHDTVELKGAPFKVYVNENDTIQAGDKIADMDLSALKAAGKDNSVMVIFTNSNSILDFTISTNGKVNAGNEIGKVELK